MQEAVTLLIWPGMHVVALTQNDPGGYGQACRVQRGFYRRPLQQQGEVAGLHVLLYFRMRQPHLGSKQFIDDHYHTPWP
jgi:hypothetical protein